MREVNTPWNVIRLLMMRFHVANRFLNSWSPHFGCYFNPIQNRLFRGCSRLRGWKTPSLKFVTDALLEFRWHQHFFSGNQQLLLYQEIHCIRHRLYFKTLLLILLSFLSVFKGARKEYFTQYSSVVIIF